MQPGIVQLHLLTAEQIFDVDLANLRDGNPSGQEIVERRYRKNGEPRYCGRLGHTASCERSGRRHRYYHVTNIKLLGYLTDVRYRTQHGNIVKHSAVFIDIVIKQSNHTPFAAP